jgi:hypothetical protein
MDFLFDALTKPALQQTPLDQLVVGAAGATLIIALLFLYFLVDGWMRERRIAQIERERGLRQ